MSLLKKEDMVELSLQQNGTVCFSEAIMELYVILFQQQGLILVC